MDTDALINNLSKQGRVCQSIWPTSWVLMLYLLLIIMALVIVLAFGELWEKFTFPQIVSAGIGLFAALLNARVAIASTVPGEMNFFKPIVAVLGLTLWLYIDEMFVRGYLPFASQASSVACERFVILASLPSGALLMFFALKRAPLRVGFTAFFAFLSAGIVANIFMRLFCSSGTLAHDLFFHLLPCAVLLLIAVKLSLRFLSWSSRLSNMFTRA